MLTDSISSMLLVSEPSGVENLYREGHATDSVHLVGNVMIDTLRHEVDRAKSSRFLQTLGVIAGEYGVVTLHRLQMSDHPATLKSILEVLGESSEKIPLVFPIHPRTKSGYKTLDIGWVATLKSLICLGPLGYSDFLCLTSQAKVIVTDSGGLQEESTALSVPCLTMRENTERPITVETVTSTLIGSSHELLYKYLTQVLEGNYKIGKCPELWDGSAADRIADCLAKWNG